MAELKDCVPCSGTGRFQGKFAQGWPECPECAGTGKEGHNNDTLLDRVVLYAIHIDQLRTEITNAHLTLDTIGVPRDKDGNELLLDERIKLATGAIS